MLKNKYFTELLSSFICNFNINLSQSNLKNIVKNTVIRILPLVLLAAFTSVSAQNDSTRSLAFKKRSGIRPSIFYYPDQAYELWQLFILTREANNGDPFAQHELGLRYLLGEGVPKDTAKAAYWIKKAADKNLTAAQYNYGIMLFNGWGTKWSPFEAFKYIRMAANSYMPQAEYIYGLLYTDNLIVKRNWGTTYKWVKRSADAGYEPAKKALEELVKKIPPSLLDSTRVDSLDTLTTSNGENPKNNNLSSSLGLVFIDFNMAYDTSSKISDKTLQNDLLLIGKDVMKDTVTVNNELTVKVDSTDIPTIVKSSEYGSPEALTFIGRMYEKGIYFKKNLITAAEYYLRAMRLDSPRAPYFLEGLEKNDEFTNLLKKKLNDKDPKAEFVLYGLFSLGYSSKFFKQDALNLLKKSANKGYLPAINELGLLYNTGNKVPKDLQKAITLWSESEKLGNEEAKIRIVLSEIFNNDSQNLNSDIKYLEKCDSLGSILAQTALGYCYENGIGVEQNDATAVRYFRTAARRGSSFAYDELKKMYNAIRPDNPIFSIN